MKFRVRDIGEVPEEVEFEYPASELNAALQTGQAHDYESHGASPVGVTHYRAGRDLFFDGVIESTIAARCVRCLEDFDVRISTELHYLVAPRDSGQDEAEDVDVTTYEGEEVDLGPLIREQILLSLPTTPICKEDCRGLCPRCGANLNRETCNCPASEGDPRMAIFRNLRVGRQE